MTSWRRPAPCLNESNLHTRRFIFGYRVVTGGTAVISVPEDDVYVGMEVLGWELDQSGAD